MIRHQAIFAGLLVLTASVSDVALGQPAPPMGPPMGRGLPQLPTGGLPQLPTGGGLPGPLTGGRLPSLPTGGGPLHTPEGGGLQGSLTGGGFPSGSGVAASRPGGNAASGSFNRPTLNTSGNGNVISSPHPERQSLDAECRRQYQRQPCSSKHRAQCHEQ